jgi:hypothetical protein
VRVFCNDSADTNFYSEEIPVNGSGQATETTLCYSADGPDHWVTWSGGQSNHVSW